MEQWEEEFAWLKVRHFVQDTFKKDKLPDLNAVLMVIGINELGQIKKKWTKEEKQDLMHIAVCKLLSFDGTYAFKGLDADGWPHFELLQPIAVKGVKEQEALLKSKCIQYFNILETETTVINEEINI